MLRILLIPMALLGMLIGVMAWSRGGAVQRCDLAFVNRGDVFTLDLNQISYSQDIRMAMAIREGLYELEPDTLKPIYAGAQSHTLSPDGRTWTFQLRRQCRWSNGDPVLARDYLFSWRRMLEEPGEYSYLFKYIKGGKAYRDGCQAWFAGEPGAARPDFSTVGVRAPDDHTVVIELERPISFLRELLAFPPFYPRHEKSMEPFKRVIDAGKGQYTYSPEYIRPPHVVTNGSFRMARWDFKHRIILEKSPFYWQPDQVKSNTVELVITDSPLSQFLIYEAGKIDWIADLDPDIGASLKAQGRSDVRLAPAYGTAFLTFLTTDEFPPSIARQVGTAKNPLADARVRQALAMTIDRQYMVQHITRMGELPARTYIPPDGTLAAYRFGPGPFSGATDRWLSCQDVSQLLANPAGLTGDGPGLPYDIPRAQRLLAEAGYPGGKGFPALPIFYSTSNPVRQKMCQALKHQWRQSLGINIVIQAMEGKTFSDRVSKKEYAIAPVAWFGDYPDATTFTDKYRSDSDQNDSLWKNAQYDDLCNQAESAPDPAMRLRILGQAEQLLLREAPIAPLYYYVNASLARANVEGVDANARDMSIFRAIKVNR